MTVIRKFRNVEKMKLWMFLHCCTNIVSVSSQGPKVVLNIRTNPHLPPVYEGLVICMIEKWPIAINLH